MAGYVTDVVGDRTRPLIRTGVVVAVIAVVLAVVTSGWWTAFWAVIAVVAGGSAGLVWLLGVVARRLISRLGPPLTGHRQAVAQALDEADLPTGPLSLLRLGRRVQKAGADDELRRLWSIVDDLRADLGEPAG